MQGDGKGWLFAPKGLVDGPLPTHYEPAESPFRNPLYGQQANPTRKEYDRTDNRLNPSPPEEHSEVFPFVFTTSRLTEHHTAGGMSRTVPYLAELQPEMFVEVSPGAGRASAGWSTWAGATSSPRRAAIEARVLVTDRLTPLRIEGRMVHQVWLPYHWGGEGLVTGDSANDLFGITLDPNVLIQESKVGTCDVRPGRRPTGPALLRPRRGLPAAGRDRTTDHRVRGRHRRPATAPPARRRAARADGTRRARMAGTQQPVRPARPGRRTPGYDDAAPRMGFFTDTSVCIGCKACEVACKEWNDVPEDGFELLGMSYDNTGALTPTRGGTSRSSSSRSRRARRRRPDRAGDGRSDGGRRRSAPTPGMPAAPAAGAAALNGRQVTRHAASAGQARRAWSRARLPLADVLRRVQALHARRLPRRLPDRVAVPHRVRHRRRAGRHLQRLRLLRAGLPVRRDRPARGRRPGAGSARCATTGSTTAMTPACAQACPTQSIQFGDARRAARAGRRAGGPTLHEQGVTEARLYGHDPDDGVGGDGAFFLLLDEPEVYGLPPDPVVTTRDLPEMWKRAGLAAPAMAAAPSPRSSEDRREPGPPGR